MYLCVYIYNTYVHVCLCDSQVIWDECGMVTHHIMGIQIPNGYVNPYRWDDQLLTMAHLRVSVKYCNSREQTGMLKDDTVCMYDTPS